jgi:hypothetical protein
MDAIEQLNWTAHLDILRRDAAAHGARKEVEGVKSAAAGFTVGMVSLFVAGLCVDEVSADAFQKARAVVVVKPQRGH